MLKVNWDPDRQALKEFGNAALALLTAAGLLSHWWMGMDARWALCFSLVGLLIYIISLLCAPLTKVLYIGILVVTLPIGWVVSHVALVIVYYLVLTPTGLACRLMRRDPLKRRFDDKATTYWIPHTPPDDVKRYLNQY